jgi:hypothetical protein
MDDLFANLTRHVGTPANKLRYIRWENQQRYKQHKAILEGFKGLCSYLSDDMARTIGIDKSALYGARKAYTHAHLQASKTFTVCPTCYEALRGRAPRKASKSSYSDHVCNICGAGPFPVSRIGVGSSNRKIHHTSTLAEANTYVRSTYPELFV